MLQVQHTTTSAYNPQCNSQAEVANKTIAKYLGSFVKDTKLDWEVYLAPLMSAYNTSFHRSIKNTPFYLTFGGSPDSPDSKSLRCVASSTANRQLMSSLRDSNKLVKWLVSTMKMQRLRPKTI